MGKNLIGSLVAVLLTACISVPAGEDCIKADAVMHNGVEYQIMSYDEVMSTDWSSYEYKCDDARFLALVDLINSNGYKEYQVGYDWANEIDGYLYVMAGFTHPVRNEIYFAPDTSFFTEIHETSHALYDLFGYPAELIDYTMKNQDFSLDAAYRFGDEDEAVADALANYFLGEDTPEAHALMDAYVNSLLKSVVKPTVTEDKELKEKTLEKEALEKKTADERRKAMFAKLAAADRFHR